MSIFLVETYVVKVVPSILSLCILDIIIFVY
jgi:hypothetical protein